MTTENTQVLDTSTPVQAKKIRKERSDKGVKRGPRKSKVSTEGSVQ